MSDAITVLNLGSGGENMDEEGVAYPTAPLTRSRSRVVICGSDRFEIARVIATDPVGTEYGLITRNLPTGTQNISLPGTPSGTYGIVTLVPSSTETTVVSFVVPALTTLHLTGFVGTGDIHARYRLYINASAKLAGRSSVAEPTVDLSLKMAAITATAGQTVTLKATHFASGLMGEFEGTILGYTT